MSDSCGSCSEKGGCDGSSCSKKSTHELSNIKHVIAVMSGKGGVGKSSVTSLLATYLKDMGYRVGILDADITGPSIPKVFGLTKRAVSSELGLFPVATVKDIQVMSLNLLIEHEDDPVIWRGPMIASMVEKFWTDVIWGELDYLLIDLPPGTGDVPLTVLQSLPVDGIVIVSSPQDLVKMIVKKAVKMTEAMKAPVLGLIENMSSIICPECRKEFKVFGKNSNTAEVAKEMGIDLLGNIPLDPEFVELSDEGRVEIYTDLHEDFKYIAEKIVHKLENR